MQEQLSQDPQNTNFISFHLFNSSQQQLLTETGHNCLLCTYN